MSFVGEVLQCVRLVEAQISIRHREYLDSRASNLPGEV